MGPTTRRSATGCRPSLLDRLTAQRRKPARSPPDQVAMTRTGCAGPCCATSRGSSMPINLEADQIARRSSRTRGQSTINYGIPALSGTKLTEINFSQFDQALTDAIIAFEPRLLADTVHVKA
jgi:type VI secretion system protein ImpF